MIRENNLYQATLQCLILYLSLLTQAIQTVPLTNIAAFSDNNLAKHLEATTILCYTSLVTTPAQKSDELDGKTSKELRQFLQKLSQPCLEEMLKLLKYYAQLKHPLPHAQLKHPLPPSINNPFLFLDHAPPSQQSSPYSLIVYMEAQWPEKNAWKEVPTDHQESWFLKLLASMVQMECWCHKHTGVVVRTATNPQLYALKYPRAKHVMIDIVPLLHDSADTMTPPQLTPFAVGDPEKRMIAAWLEPLIKVGHVPWAGRSYTQVVRIPTVYSDPRITKELLRLGYHYTAKEHLKATPGDSMDVYTQHTRAGWLCCSPTICGLSAIVGIGVCMYAYYNRCTIQAAALTISKSCRPVISQKTLIRS